MPAPREEKRPDQARFASEHDTSVTRETRKYGKFDPKARQGDAAGAESESKPSQPAPPARTPPQMAMRDPRPVPGRADSTPMGRERPAPAGSENGVADQEAPDPDGMHQRLGKLQIQPGSLGQPGGRLSLMPSEAQLARAIGSGTEDALKDVDDADETALNSKKWRFASFFNRVKHQVQEHWHPDEVYRRRDPNGSI